MRNPIAGWLLFCLCVMFQVEGARGADVVALAPCDISISGVLEAGDSADLKQLLHDAPCSYSTVRLDSPGGSLSEALEIAESFFRTKTIIGDGDECLSACAILFMTGRACSGAPQTCNPLREMHKTATLGFHAPFLEASGGDVLAPRDVSFSQAASVFAEILDRLAGISAEVRMTGYDKDIIPSDLLTRIFVTPPEEFYLVETNDQFFSWDIDLVEDEAKPGEPALTETQVHEMCETLVTYEMMGWSYANGEPGGSGDAPTVHDDSASRLLTRKLDTSNLPDDVNPNAVEYLLRLDQLALPIYWVSGWCHVTPSPWHGGHFQVSFRGDFGDVAPDFDTGKDWSHLPAASLSFDRGMHYSMALPLGTPVRSVSLR